MIKIKSTQVKKIVVDGAEANYVKMDNTYILAKPFKLTFTQTNCTFSVVRTSTKEPSASLNTPIPSGGTIYYGDVLEIKDLKGNFGYDRAWTSGWTSGNYVTGDVSITSGASEITLLTLTKGSTFETSVAGKTVQYGYRLKNNAGNIMPLTSTTSGSSLTLKLKDTVDRGAHAYTLQIVGLYNDKYYIFKEYSIYGDSGWTGVRDISHTIGTEANTSWDDSPGYALYKDLTWGWSRKEPTTETYSATQTVSGRNWYQREYVFYIPPIANRTYSYTGTMMNAYGETATAVVNGTLYSPFGCTLSGWSFNASYNPTGYTNYGYDSYSCTLKVTHPGSWYMDSTKFAHVDLRVAVSYTTTAYYAWRNFTFS